MRRHRHARDSGHSVPFLLSMTPFQGQALSPDCWPHHVQLRLGGRSPGLTWDLPPETPPLIPHALALGGCTCGPAHPPSSPSSLFRQRSTFSGPPNRLLSAFRGDTPGGHRARWAGTSPGDGDPAFPGEQPGMMSLVGLLTTLLVFCYPDHSCHPPVLSSRW